jgi:hypothetical protein
VFNDGIVTERRDDDRSMVMSGDLVNVQNFARAETDRMFASFVSESGGVNRWFHNRTPTPLDRQPVIRMNRDTLYSFAVIDISQGAAITLPDGGDRYLSVMVVNEDHYINRIFHTAGEYELTTTEFETPFVTAAARVLVDPNNADDLAAVTELQNRLDVRGTSARPFVSPEYDTTSLDTTRDALLVLAKGLHEFAGAFGPKAQVDPVLHLLGTAAGWGGLPDSEAHYLGFAPDLPVGKYTLRVGEVPVDAFWSISVYDNDGYFPNQDQAVSLNSLTAARDRDGTVTVHLGNWDDDTPNRLLLTDGWNYLVRLYRPRPEVLDGTWTFPTVQPA